jgi:polyhydroxyalkanoate synthesis regulator phasin
MRTETTATENQAKSTAEEAGVDESPLADALGKVGLASIGALSLALETAEKLLKRLVERGEIDERNARRTFRELRRKRPHLPRPRPVIGVGMANLASKADIQALEGQVAALAARVEHLSEASPVGSALDALPGTVDAASEGTASGV